MAYLEKVHMKVKGGVKEACPQRGSSTKYYLAVLEVKVKLYIEPSPL